MTQPFLRSERSITFVAFIATFGLYFCSYTLRKPFTTGLYSPYELGGISLKTVLVLAQVGGYLVSKFIGIRVISALQPHQRLRYIALFLITAWFGLLLFGLLPLPWRWVGLFLNGLPLGMMWGLVFSFVEGRRLTELLAIGLSANLIISSGILKSIYLVVQSTYQVSEFWMPALMGAFSLPFAALFAWLLYALPAPTAEDNAYRVKRRPMQRRHKTIAWTRYGFGLVCMIVLYSMLTMLRDFRDNFYVEIWHELQPNHSPFIFAQTELWVAVVVLGCIGSLCLVKDSYKAFAIICFVLLATLLGIGQLTARFQQGALAPEHWMLALGFCLFLPYLLIQVAYFERWIAVFNVKGNVGYFVYLCDSVGYLGSVLLLLYREFYAQNVSWSNIFIEAAKWVSIIGVTLALAQAIFFLHIFWQRHTKQQALKLN